MNSRTDYFADLYWRAPALWAHHARLVRPCLRAAAARALWAALAGDEVRFADAMRSVNDCLAQLGGAP